MPKVKCERVDPVFDGGLTLWRVELKYDRDLDLTAHGESLSVALTKLGLRVRGLEQAERLSRAVMQAEG